MIFDVVVDVQLRPGISDPAGSTVERSLPALGFEGVSGVRVGKSIRFSIDSPDEASATGTVRDLCDRLLTNPVIESADIALSPVAGG